MRTIVLLELTPASMRLMVTLMVMTAVLAMVTLRVTTRVVVVVVGGTGFVLVLVVVLAKLYPLQAVTTSAITTHTLFNFQSPMRINMAASASRQL